MTIDEILDTVNEYLCDENGAARAHHIDLSKAIESSLLSMEARLKAADEFIANFNTEMGLGRLEVVRDGVFEQLEENYRNAGETK